MIHVERTTKPQSLVDHAVIWKQQYIDARMAEDSNPTAENKKWRKQVETKYAQNDVKKALRRMFHRKCAFCEQKRDHPHIEHFYPKANFPERCFDWENLLLSCEVCNGAAYKGLKFPLDTDGNPLFINPCFENPEDHLEFVFEEDAMHPDGFIAVVRGKTEKGKTTINILGLNRPNLMADRNDLLFPYYIKLAEEAKNGDVKSIKLLRRACESKSVFAAFARSLWK